MMHMLSFKATQIVQNLSMHIKQYCRNYIDSSSSEEKDDDPQAKRTRKERKEQKMLEMITAAIHQEVAQERDGHENLISERVRQEVARTAPPDNTPNSPEGNDLVTIDEHLSDMLIADIANEKYIELSKVSSVESVRGEEEYQLVYDKQVNKVYKRSKNPKKLTFSNICTTCLSLELATLSTNPKMAHSSSNTFLISWRKISTSNSMR